MTTLYLRNGFNRWLSMIFAPRSAIQSAVQARPCFGFWIFSSIYGIASSAYTMHFYSWGLSIPFFAIILLLLLLAPFVGALSISVDAWVLLCVARIIGASQASFSRLRTAVAWSKAPFAFSLVLWICLAALHPETTFIHYIANNSTVVIIFISLIVNAWVFGLLVQSIRELQAFTFLQAFGTVFFSYFISFILYLFVLFSIRYIYTSF